MILLVRSQTDDLKFLDTEHLTIKSVCKLTPDFISPQIKEKLDRNGAPTELTEQLHHVKDSFDQLKSCSWD